MLGQFLISVIENNLKVFWILMGLLFLGLTEFYVVKFSKGHKRRESLTEATMLIKSLGMIAALGTIIAYIVIILALLLILDIVSTYYVGFLMTLGVVGLLIGFFWLNSFIVRKYSSEVKHKNNFKKDDMLKAISDGSNSMWSIDKGDIYQFIKNLEYDIIKVKFIEKGSKYNGEILELKEKYFKKK